MPNDPIKKAAGYATTGKIIAFATDTVFGLACDAANEDAAKRIYTIKGRSFDKPLPVLTHCTKSVLKFASLSPLEKKLIKLFWPGAMTLILNLKQTDLIAPSVTQGQSTIAVRMPQRLSILRLLKEVGRPLATTSLNLSGDDPILLETDIPEELKQKIDYIMVDDSHPASGKASTIIRCDWDDFKILRQGDLTREEILKRLTEA